MTKNRYNPRQKTCKIPYCVLIIIFTVLGGYRPTALKAQIDPGFTQFMYNPVLINPAYAGSKETFNAAFLSRHQWIGFEGAPQTQTFSAHIPFAKQRFGAGLSYVNDRLGPLNHNRFSIDYAFHINVSQASKLSLGIKAGFESLFISGNELSPLNSNISDPAYYEADERRNLLNFGTGLFYYSRNGYVGISVLDIQTILLNEENETSTDKWKDSPQTFLTGGFIWDAAPEWKIKPSFLARHAPGMPLTLDVNLNMMYNEKIVSGVSHRINDSFGFMLQFRAFNGLWVGYAYDLGISELNLYNQGTHEVMIVFDFMRSEKTETIISPRFF
ncbi:MAG: type IX secretion system membrane protein PorP/SprF [Bacteroidota bacterium]